MRERIRLHQKSRYSRIAARIPADLDQACRRLVRNEGWELGDLHRSLILLGACGSFLALRSRRSRDSKSSGSFPRIVKEYLGGRMYSPRTGQRSRLVTVSLPERLAALLTSYSRLSGRLRSHTYARLLRAGLLVYLTSQGTLVDGLKAADTETNGPLNHGRR